MLENAGEVVVWGGDEPMPATDLAAAITDATGLYCMLTDRIDEALLEAAPHLRVISTMAVGVDNIDIDACTRRGIPVGHTPGVLAGTVADLAIGLLLAGARRIVEGVDYVRAGRWQTWEPDLMLGQDLHGSTVGIVGFGQVGRTIARRLSGFDCRILVHNRTPPADAETIGVEPVVLEDLLEQSDHVVVAVALTPSTRHLIDAAALAAMKPTATLVNVSRGGTVDQVALTDALHEGIIAMAALDVTEPEPIAPYDPLLAMSNCIVIPHLGSSTVRTREAMAHLAARNVLAGLAGQRLEACVNPEVYDR